MNQGVRPNKLWHWAALAVLAATFLAEPKAFLALTKDLFTGAGQVGGALITNDDQPTQSNGTTPDTDTGAAADDDEFGPPTDTSFTPPAPVAGECTQNVFDCCPTVERHLDNLADCLAIAFNTTHPTTDDEAAIGGVIDASLIRSVLDRGAEVVVGLHGRVEQVRDEGLYMAVDADAMNPTEGPDR